MDKRLLKIIQQSMINVERTVTLPDERYRALVWADKFLQDLTDPSKTPRVPKSIRQHARMILRHYPGAYYIDQMARKSPDIIAKEMEELHRFIKSGQQQEEDK